MRFLPKNEGFFDLFDQLSAHLNTSALMLRELFEDPRRIDELLAKMKAEEHAADDVTYEINQRVDRSFVTPLDREDIHMLAHRLDNVVDLMDGNARRVAMFHVTERREAALELVDVLVQCSQAIGRGVKSIRKREGVHQAAREVKALEERADMLYAKAIAGLFAGTPDPLEVIKWKEIYDNLEHAADECEDVANVLESISLKNS